MTTLTDLRKFVLDKIAENPDQRESIEDFYYLCIDEIEEGGSIMNEISLCVNSIEELLIEAKTK